MDFFEHQDKARRNTKLLVFYFVVAVVLIVVSVYLASLLAFQGVSSSRYRGRQVQQELVLWRPELFFWVTVGVLGVVACGSLFKTAQLAQGGGSVATSLGGRLLKTNTTNPEERKLLNVVEEMALASGTPVPQVYVLERELGINAFAAGHTPSDAVIGVTRGCMQLLSRDELQGVIGHEFSHILNGDMRLNVRLMGIIFGILCLAVIGRILIYTRGRKNPLPLLGLALILVGWVGVFFGRLIQAAVSRQREFLADASAVQFTRNPAGLSGALQKIGGLAYGSKLESPHASEASHMFFGNAVGQSFLNSMATHPPLEQRIRAIDPSWDGRFPRVTLPGAQEVSKQLPQQLRRRGLPPILSIPGMPGAAAAGLAPTVVRPQTVLPNLGKPTPLHLHYAEELRNSFPESLQSAAHDPLAASALICAMLLSSDAALRATQLQELAKRTSSAVAEKAIALLPEVAPVAQRARLPLVNLSIPALRSLHPKEFEEFRSALQWLIQSDKQIDLFEYVLQKVIQRHLEPHFGRPRRVVVQYYSLRPLVPDCAVVLSSLAHISSGDAAEVEKAFRKGTPYLRAPEGAIPLLPRDGCGLAQIDASLNRLSQAVPQIKKNVLEACIQIVGADGVIQEREAELLRGVADTLDCPIPPFVQGG